MRCAAATIDVGAVVTFVGTVRDVNDGDAVTTLELEHYPGMTEKALEAIEAEARERFDVRASRSCIASARSRPAIRSCWSRSPARTAAPRSTRAAS
jgi:hypothetical protein